MTTRTFDWTDLLGQHRVIAIHTPILAWAGDYHAAALFEELVWRWNATGRQSFTAPDADLMAKLYMTRGALRGARARLVELGAIETVKRGIPPMLHYTVNPGAVTTSVESTSVRNSPNDDAESAQREAETEPTYIPESLQSQEQSNTPRATSNGDVGAGGADLAPEVAPPTERHAGSSSPWDTLGRTIAFDLTGSEERAYITRGRRAGALQAWIGHIVGDVGRVAENDPGAALDMWIMFRASVPPDDWERYVSRATARERFGRWTLNGGAASVAAVLAGRGDTRVMPGGGAA